MRLLNIVAGITIATTGTGFARTIFGDPSIRERMVWVFAIVVLAVFGIFLEYCVELGEITIFGRKFRVIDTKKKTKATECKVVQLHEYIK